MGIRNERMVPSFNEVSLLKYYFSSRWFESWKERVGYETRSPTGKFLCPINNDIGESRRTAFQYFTISLS
jgi:hypothetical protein